MNHDGPFNPAFGIESFGLNDLKSIVYNLEVPRLVGDAIRRGKAMVAKGGALSAKTGIHTGRSPNNKFAVRDAVTDKTVWWDNTKAMPPHVRYAACRHARPCQGHGYLRPGSLWRRLVGAVGGVDGRDCDTGLATSVGTKLQEEGKWMPS
jgi:hypothetical protein